MQDLPEIWIADALALVSLPLGYQLPRLLELTRAIAETTRSRSEIYALLLTLFVESAKVLPAYLWRISATELADLALALFDAEG